MDRHELTTRIRDRVIGEMHLGHVRAGARLPSVRELGAELNADARAVARAYRQLASEGLVEVRGRAGVFLAPQDRAGAGVSEEIVSWLATVVAEARRRRIGIPQLPDFIRQCTGQRKLRCVCFESNVDSGTALTLELEEEFGLECRLLDVDAIRLAMPTKSAVSKSAGPTVQRADLLATTAFHAREVRSLAKRLNKPFAIVTVSEELARIIERRVAAGGLTAVVVDPKYADRLRSIYGKGSAPGAIRILFARDRDQVLLLNRSAPVLVTRAARRLLPDLDVPLLVPRYPSISPESARTLAELIIRLNISQQSVSA